MPNSPAPNNRFSITVTAPGHDTVHIGPFTEHWTARSFAYTLAHGVRGAGAPEGTDVDVTTYDPGQPHRCVPAAHPAELARQMDTEPDSDDFPDLFTRLVAHRGWEDAARAWLTARAHRAQAARSTPDGTSDNDQPGTMQTFTVFGIIDRNGPTPTLDIAGIVAGEAPRVDLYDKPWSHHDVMGRFSTTVQAATWQDAEQQAHEGVESGTLHEPWR